MNQVIKLLANNEIAVTEFCLMSLLEKLDFPNLYEALIYILSTTASS